MKKIMKFIFKLTDISIIFLVICFYPVYSVMIFMNNTVFENIVVNNPIINNFINFLYSKSLLGNSKISFWIFMYVVVLSVIYFIKFAADAAVESKELPKTIKKMFLIWGAFFPSLLICLSSMP